MSAKKDLDKLIDWYEKNNPKAGQTIPVAIGPSALARMFGLKVKPKEPIPTEHTYRSRTIVAVGEDKK